MVGVICITLFSVFTEINVNQEIGIVNSSVYHLPVFITVCVMMELGNFSVSLAVKDIAVSKAFYEKLGFSEFGGDESQGWLILQNGPTTIGLFQGMFEKNTLTFNPGWNSDAMSVDNFTDVRDIQKHLKSEGVKIDMEADENTSGPASLMVTDPDGNPILIDQHV